MSKTFVPEHRGIPIDKDCTGIPADQWLQKTKEAIEDHMRETNLSQQAYRLSDYTGTEEEIVETTIRDVIKVEIVDNERLKITADKDYFIKPTMWGVAYMGFFNELKRFWINKGGEFVLMIQVD